MKHIVFFSLLLCACYPAAPTPVIIRETVAVNGEPVDCLPTECGRIIAEYTATAAVVATQNAIATQARVSTLQAGELAATDSALQFAATLQAATVSALEITRAVERDNATRAWLDSQLAQTSIAATSIASQTQQAQATATAIPLTALHIAAVIEADRQRETGAATRENLDGLTASVGMFALVVILAAAAGLALWYVYRRAQSDLHARQRDAMMYKSPVGLVVVERLPSGQLAPRFLSAPIDNAEREHTAPVERVSVPIQTGGRVVGEVVKDWEADADKRTRAAISDLLTAAITVNGEGGRIIPSFRNIPGYKTRSTTWQKLTDTLQDAGVLHKIKNAGDDSGTFLAGEWTLYSLLAGVKDGSVPITKVEVIRN